MSFQIFKRELSTGKDTAIRATTSSTWANDLCKVLEQMEDEGYIQCEAPQEETEHWDNEFGDWVLVCDAEAGDDRTLIFVQVVSKPVRKMMFRGYAIPTVHQKAGWVIGFYFNTTPVNITNHYIKVDGRDILVDPNSVGEWAGLVDKNDNPIFEGDIITFVKGQKRKDPNSEWEDDVVTIVVEYGKGGFNIGNPSLGEVEDSLTIIGNIYENPELLNK